MELLLFLAFQPVSISAMQLLSGLLKCFPIEDHNSQKAWRGYQATIGRESYQLPEVLKC
jgi:hypothetical protein